MALQHGANRSKSLKSTAGIDFLVTDYSYDSHRRLEWTRPAASGGLRIKNVYDSWDRLVEKHLYRNDSDTHLIGKSSYTFTSTWRPEATRIHTVASGAEVNPAKYLETSRVVYDNAGRVRKQETAGKGFTKIQYDAHGRQKTVFTCSDEGGTIDPDGVSGDIVLQETVYDYDNKDRVILVTTYERTHTATATGALSAASTSESRVTRVATWYDKSDRPTHVRNWGTLTFAGRDESGDTAVTGTLLTKALYDGAGRADRTIDPAGVVTKREFDSLGRTTKLIENYVEGSPTPTATANRTTSYKYNAAGQVTHQNAEMLSGTSDDQITRYVYSASLSAANKGSSVKSNGLLRAIVYPDNTLTNQSPETGSVLS